METINDRLQQLVNAYGGVGPVTLKAELAQGSLSNYLNKGSKPGTDILVKIVNSLDVDANWLLTGKGDMKRKEIPDPLLFNQKLLEVCKSLIANYQQRDEVMAQLISMVKQME